MKAELKLWLNVLTRNILDSTGLTSPNPDQEDKSQSERIFSVFYNRLARLKGIEDDYIFN